MIPLREKFSGVTLDNVLKHVLNSRVLNEDEETVDRKRVFFKPIEYKGDVAYLVKTEHVVIDDVFKYAHSRCKDCNSKGYYVAHIEKAKLPNPVNYVLLSNSPTESLKDMSETQLKIWKEKMAKETAWRVMLPCHCVMKKGPTKDRSLFFNGDGSIRFRSECEEIK